MKLTQQEEQLLLAAFDLYVKTHGIQVASNCLQLIGKIQQGDAVDDITSSE